MKPRDPSLLDRGQGFVVDVGIADEEIFFKTHHVTSVVLQPVDGSLGTSLDADAEREMNADSAQTCSRLSATTRRVFIGSQIFTGSPSVASAASNASCNSSIQHFSISVKPALS